MFLQPPQSYGQMLSRIALGTFVTTLGCSLVIAMGVPEYADAIGLANIKVSILGIGAVPLGHALVAGVVAGLARVFRLHDRISDVLAIRPAFDVIHILVPLAGGSGVPVSARGMRELKSRRDELMQSVFYRYASSTEPVISKHLVFEALDFWGWYWVVVESVAVALVTFVVLLLSRAYALAAGTAAVVFMLLIIGHAVLQKCEDNAYVEVAEILSSGDRCNDVKKAFDALLR